MARPVKDETEGLTDRITVRYKLADLDEVRERAEAMGLGAAEYIRQRSLKGSARPAIYRKGIDPALITEINALGIEAVELANQSARIGNVAKQIVRAINLDRGVIAQSDSWLTLPALIEANQAAIKANQEKIDETLAKVLTCYDQ